MLVEIAKGLPYTVLITLAGFAIGCVLGIPLVLGRRSRIAPIRWVARTYIEFLRSVPPIVWLFVIYFGLGDRLAIDPVPAAIVALGAISSAYLAEIYRGGFASVHLGQWEASEALGMPHGTVLARIIAPQVVRVSVPAAASYGIALFKDSSIAFTIGVTELTYYANREALTSAEATTPYLIAAVMYIAVSVPCAYIARRLDKNLRVRIAR